MTIRRFLLHVLPDGFHRIRDYGLFANATRAGNIAKARALLDMPAADVPSNDESELQPPCPCCGGRMLLVEIFARRAAAKTWLSTPIIQFFDTS